MAYYDRIAKRWHEITGYQGGSFKRHVLNELLIEMVGAVAGRAILELGAGNGYFMPLVMARYSGQVPARLVISDGSAKLLAIAESAFFIPGAEYLQLDVRSRYPFDDGAFDLIVATMVFNEVSTGGLRRALRECHRVLAAKGELLLTITHPAFVASLDRRQQLRADRRGRLTMPGPAELRLPIVPRRVRDYERLLAKAGFAWEKREVHLTEEVLHEKRGLRKVGERPVGLIFRCQPADRQAG